MRYYSTTAGEMTLQATVTSSDTSVQVDTTAGLPASYPYTIILDYGTSAEEVVSVTAAAGTTLVVTRGEDGTAAQAHTLGAKIRHGMTARDLRESRQHEAATAAHGVGEVVGTTETQTLEGKTFEPATDVTAVSFKAKSGNTAPHTAVKDSADSVVARWYESMVEFISGSTVYARIRYGGGPAVLKTILDLRVADDIHALQGSVTGTPTGKFLRLLNGVTELFSVNASGKVKAAGAELTADTTVAGAFDVTGNASVSGTLTAPVLTTHASDISALDGRVTTLEGPKRQHGVATMLASGSTYASVNVTFGTAFPGTPTVVLTAENVSVNVGVSARTSTGFTISGRRVDLANMTSDVSVDWVATYN